MMVKHCRLENCKAPAVDSSLSPGAYGNHGLCKRHYSRLNGGYIDVDGHTLKPSQRNRLGANKCRVIECMAKPRTVGLCTWHYRNMHDTPTSVWAVDYDDSDAVMSFQDWDALRSPAQPPAVPAAEAIPLDDPDEDQAPLRLVSPQTPQVRTSQVILDIGEDHTIHPDVILLNGIRFVPEASTVVLDDATKDALRKLLKGTV